LDVRKVANSLHEHILESYQMNIGLLVVDANKAIDRDCCFTTTRATGDEGASETVIVDHAEHFKTVLCSTHFLQ